jgi:hypothetical protein
MTTLDGAAPWLRHAADLRGSGTYCVVWGLHAGVGEMAVSVFCAFVPSVEATIWSVVPAPYDT